MGEREIICIYEVGSAASLAPDGWMEILTLGSLAPSGQASKGQRRRRGPRRGRETEEKGANGGEKGG